MDFCWCKYRWIKHNSSSSYHGHKFLLLHKLNNSWIYKSHSKTNKNNSSKLFNLQLPKMNFFHFSNELFSMQPSVHLIILRYMFPSFSSSSIIHIQIPINLNDHHYLFCISSDSTPSNNKQLKSLQLVVYGKPDPDTNKHKINKEICKILFKRWL